MGRCKSLSLKPEISGGLIAALALVAFYFLLIGLVSRSRQHSLELLAQDRLCRGDSGWIWGTGGAFQLYPEAPQPYPVWGRGYGNGFRHQYLDSLHGGLLPAPSWRFVACFRGFRGRHLF